MVAESPISTFSPVETSAGSVSNGVSNSVSSVSSGGFDILTIILICIFAAAAIILAIIAISSSQKNKRLLAQLGGRSAGPAYGAVPGYQPVANICAKCGAMHAPGAAFCPNCGSKLI